MVDLDIRPSDLDQDQSAAVPTGAQLAIATLERHGVRTVFGVPGVHTLALYDALIDSGIEHILARHEQGAGFMADGYARATGEPGVAVIITGPGITNVATPVGEAYADSSPVFILSSNVERPYVDQMRGSLHDLKDQLGLMSAVTQWNTRVTDPNHASNAIGEAMQRLRTGRPLPVHVEIPLDVLDEPALSGEATAPSAIPASEPDAKQIIDAVREIEASDRVVIYAGGGAVHAAAGEAILGLAERLNAVIVTSTMGKGSVPEDHPRVLGTLWSPENEVNTLVRGADCLLVFGSKLGIQATNYFQFPLPDRLVRIDIDPRELTLNAKPSVGIVADARLGAQALFDTLSESNAQPTGYSEDDIADVRSKARETAFGADRLPYLDALRAAIPREGIVTFDMTMMSYAAIGLFPVYEPRTFMFPSGYGTLGFSLPAALGAKVGRPNTPVVCVVGDGGFQYTMEELGTAVHHKLGVPIVIFNDSTYSAVKDEQRRSRGGRYLAVDLVNPDYVALAAAYGIPGVRAESPEVLTDAIQRALSRDVPTIIDVPIAPWVETS